MNAKYPDRCTMFLLAKIYKSTGTKTTKFQGAKTNLVWTLTVCNRVMYLMSVNSNKQETRPKGFSAFKCDVGNWKIHTCDIF